MHLEAEQKLIKYDIKLHTRIKIHTVVDLVCEECKKEEESVKQNLIMHGYKICESCNLAKTIFPI